MTTPEKGAILARSGETLHGFDARSPRQLHLGTQMCGLRHIRRAGYAGRCSPQSDRRLAHQANQEAP